MAENADAEPEKKIIIDEDWKSRVQAEKEELQRKQREKEAPGAARPPGAEGPLPPPTLDVLVSSLGVQAMIAMGLVPNPVDGKTGVHLDQAKHAIDTIAMLEEKTEGNRTPEESRMLGNLLHELRMSYLAVAHKQAEGS